MNRYTDITPSAYSPMTMQEIMMAPLTKRKQHDDTEAAYQSYLTELAKVDPTDRDWEEATLEKKRLSEQIQAGTELLSKEGYNNNTKSNLLSLNRDYQESIGATGKIGMFNARKLEKDKDKAEYLDNVVKQGFTAENAQDWLTEAEKEYNQTPVYDEKGRVTGFSTDKYMPPKYKDEEEWRINLFKNAGIDEEDFARSGSQIVKDEKGDYVINSGRNWGTSTNVPNLEAGLKYIEGELNRKDSDIRKSLDFQRKSIDDVLSNSENLKNVFIKEGTKDQKQSSISSFTPKETKTVDPSGMIISNDSTLTSDALNESNYQNVIKNINQLQSSKSLSSAERAKLEDLKELKEIADAKIVKDPKYIKTYNNVKNKEKEAELFIAKNFEKADGVLKRKKNAEPGAELKLNKLQNEIISLNKEKYEIQNEYWKQSSSLRHNYSYFPKTEKEESAWNLHNENVFNTLNGIIDLGSVLDLTSISTSGGTTKDLDASDVTNLQEVLRAGDPKSFKINNIKTYGDNRTPEITITFVGGDGADRKDTSSGNVFYNEYGGKGKPVTATFKLKKFSNASKTGSAVGYKNLSGAIADFWKDKGGINQITGNFQGTEVSNALIENQYADVSDEELKNLKNIDSDAREAYYIRLAKYEASKKK